MIRTIIFDLDGTLVDTEPAAAVAVRECFAGWGIQIDPADAGFVAGRTWAKAFEFLFAKYKLPIPEKQAAEEMLATYRAGIEKHLVIVPGSREAVRSLATKFGLGLVSGSNRSEIFFALDRLGLRDLFQIVLGAEDYPRSKPAPDGYLKALKILSTDPAHSLIFEDSEPGVNSARAAGAWVVAITGTNHFQQDVSQAHEHIPDLTQVNAEWVEQFCRRKKITQRVD